MRLFPIRKHQPNQQQIQREIQEIHRYYLGRVGVPRKLRQYEAQSALMKVNGFTPEKAAATIAKWNAGYRERQQQRWQNQQRLAHLKTAASVQQPNPSTQSTLPVPAPVTPSEGTQNKDPLELSLEEKLKAMDLISDCQLEIARMETMTCRYQRTMTMILVEKGWIKAETIRFLQIVLPRMRSRPRGLSICDYLQQAGLLTQGQVMELNQDKQTSGFSFAEAAVAKGWVKQKAIEFITDCLNV